MPPRKLTIDNDNSGRVVAVLGHVAEVEFFGDMPEMHHMLRVDDEPEVVLKVYASATNTS